MLIKPANIERFIKAPPKDVSIIMLFGPDEGQVRERAKKLAKTIVKDLDDPFNTAQLSTSRLTENPSCLYEEMAAQSLMGGRRLIRIRDGGDAIHPAIKNLIDALPATDSLLIIEAGDLQSSSKLKKLFSPPNLTSAAAIPCYKPEANDLKALAESMLREASIRITRDGLELFSTLVASDSAMARGEIEKLILFAGKNGSLDYDDIAKALGDSAILNMDAPAWAAASGNLQELDRSLERLYADGLSTIAILRSAQQHFLRLYEVASANQPTEIAIKSLRPPVFWKDITRFRQQVSIWQGKKAEEALSRLIATEADCKKTGVRDTTLCARTLMSIAGMARKGA